MRRISITALTLIGLCAASSGTASAETIKFCFYGQGDYSDNGYSIGGVTEDYWTNDLVKVLRGARMTVRRTSPAGPIIFDSYLGDGFGTGDPGVSCTTTLTVSSANDTYYFLLQSTSGYIDGHTLNVRYYDQDDDAEYAYNLGTYYVHTYGQGLFYITMTPSDDTGRAVWRIYAAAALAIARTGRWTSSGSTVNVVFNEFAGGSSYSSGSNKITLSDSAKTKKYTMAHEVGHKLADVYSGDVGGNCGLSATACPASSGTHSFGSQEYQTCAYTEGLAQYFSAVTWNDISQNDCVFRYYKTEPGAGYETVDCEGGDNTYFPVKYMETNCDTPYGDRGNELDWLRQLWDVLTNDPGVTFEATMDWIDISNVMAPFTADPYYELGIGANSTGGTINTNWDGADGANGIDW